MRRLVALGSVLIMFSFGNWASSADAAVDPSESAPYEETFDVNDPEVTQYAGHYGISLERAREIALWMSEAGQLIESLESQLEGNYADARVLHGGDRGGPLDDNSLPAGELLVVISLKEPNAPNALAAVSQIPRRPGITVETRTVPKSLSELRQEAANLPSELPDGTKAHVDMDFENGKVRLVPFEPRGEVELLTCSPSSVAGGNLDGSRAVFTYSDGCSPVGECTAGFPARFNGVIGYVTAGHCMGHPDIDIPQYSNGRVIGTSNWRNDMHWVHQPNDVYVSASSYWYDFDADDFFSSPDPDYNNDVGFANRQYANTGYPGRLWKWDTGEWRRIERYSQAPRGLGLTICVAASSNSSTGASTYCGVVTDRYANPLGGSLHYTEYDAFQAPFGESITPGQGASGAPAWYGDTVYGILTASKDGRWGYIYRAGIARSRMESIYSGTDTYFVCWNGQNCLPN